jgi:hypothetical protein
LADICQNIDCAESLYRYLNCLCYFGFAFQIASYRYRGTCNFVYLLDHNIKPVYILIASNCLCTSSCHTQCRSPSNATASPGDNSALFSRLLITTSISAMTNHFAMLTIIEVSK